MEGWREGGRHPCPRRRDRPDAAPGHRGPVRGGPGSGCRTTVPPQPGAAGRAPGSCGGRRKRCPAAPGDGRPAAGGGPGHHPTLPPWPPRPVPPPHGVPERGQAAGAGAQPGGRGGGGAWTDPAMPTSAGRRGGDGLEPCPAGSPAAVLRSGPSPAPCFPSAGLGRRGGGAAAVGHPRPPPAAGSRR